MISNPRYLSFVETSLETCRRVSSAITAVKNKVPLCWSVFTMLRHYTDRLYKGLRKSYQGFKLISMLYFVMLENLGHAGERSRHKHKCIINNPFQNYRTYLTSIERNAINSIILCFTNLVVVLITDHTRK